MPRRRRSDLIYRIEALLLRAFFAFSRTLPLESASALGGWLGRRLGPRLRFHRIARDNLALALPERAAEHDDILMRMWANLGRNFAELAHLPGLSLFRRTTVEGAHYLPAPGEAVIFFSGHIGQWELLPGVAFEYGVPVTLIYRHLNNPYADAILARLRAAHTHVMLQKGRHGAVKIARALKENESLAMLVDQKMNEGIAVPFFGHPAMTAPALADLSLRYRLPIVPARVIRKDGCHFHVQILPPMEFTPSGNPDADILAVMTRVNTLLESWIREYPEQWLWGHRRWPSSPSS